MMKKDYLKRLGAIVLVLMIVLANNPMTVRAEEGDTVPTVDETSTVPTETSTTEEETKAPTEESAPSLKGEIDSSKTVREYGKVVTEPVEFMFNKDKFDAKNSNVPYDYQETGTYTAKYPDSFTYFNNRTLSIAVTVTYAGHNRYYDSIYPKTIATGDWQEGIKFDTSRNEFVINSFGNDYDVEIQFFEDNTFTTPATNFSAAVAFRDPDQANYLFNATNYPLYYLDKQDATNQYWLSDFYKVTSKGLFNKNEADVEFNSWPDFQIGEFYVVLDNDAKFTYHIEGKQDVLRVLSSIMKVNVPYNVQYYYEVAGEYPADDNPDYKAPERKADIFVDKTVSVTDADKVPNKEKGEQYTLDLDKNAEWSKSLASDGTTVLKVYFMQSYTIRYDGNGGTLPEGKEMADDVYTYKNEKMPSKEEWLFERDGYDYLGFKVEKEGEILNGSQEYREDLLKDEDRLITLYAQWDPWKYTIKYDANGGVGTMPDHNYTFDNETFMSDKNLFTRDGYKFTGFVYTDKDGNSKLYTSVNDFRKILVDLGKNSSITLVAQWERIPEPKTVYYEAPKTGIE